MALLVSIPARTAPFRLGAAPFAMDLNNRKLLGLVWFQGLFYASTGFWPIVEVDSFMAVTGPKTDIWLVRTVGALLTVTGMALIWAAKRRHVPIELAVLAVGQPLALIAIDVVYVGAGRISPIYLLDAAAEALLVFAWARFYAWRREARPPAVR